MNGVEWATTEFRLETLETERGDWVVAMLLPGPSAWRMADGTHPIRSLGLTHPMSSSLAGVEYGTQTFSAMDSLASD